LEKEGKRIFKFEGVCLVLNSANEFPLSGSSDSQAFAETIVAARNGDEAAFSFLFETYKARICTYLAHLIGNEEEGRDLAQDTFLKAWRALPQTHKALQFEAWLYRIATNTALDYLRSQKLRGLLWKGRGEADHLDHISIEGQENRIAEEEQIKQALAEVSPQYRACLLLQDVAGFKQREIATLLNMKEKNVSVYVRRGCEQFSAAYQCLEHGQTDPKKRRSSR